MKRQITEQDKINHIRKHLDVEFIKRVVDDPFQVNGLIWTRTFHHDVFNECIFAENNSHEHREAIRVLWFYYYTYCKHEQKRFQKKLEWI